jgi:metal-responsive CopG/Arc/MetJ family transcriptional regulator
VASVDTPVRRSVSLPARLAKLVATLAETKKTSASRVLVDLIETGLQAKEAQHRRFFEVTDQLAEATDPAERARLQEELARMTFAE